ncbi:hypothetical protein GCM10023212_04010 [Luteolibacter yonseiensis]
MKTSANLDDGDPLLSDALKRMRDVDATFLLTAGIRIHRCPAHPTNSPNPQKNVVLPTYPTVPARQISRFASFFYSKFAPDLTTDLQAA